MSRKYKMDFMLGLTFLIISIVMFALSFGLRSMVNIGIGPGFYPRLIAVLTAITSLALMYQSYNKSKLVGVSDENESESETEEVSPIFNAEVVKILFVMIVYAALIRSVGYLIMTTVYLFLHFMIVSKKESRRIPLFVIVSIIISVGTYYGFRNIFGVLLPSGILG